MYDRVDCKAAETKSAYLDQTINLTRVYLHTGCEKEVPSFKGSHDNETTPTSAQTASVHRAP